MKVLVIGCGNIGERHISNLLALKQEVLVHDVDQNRLEEVAYRYGVNPRHDFPVDAMVICTPPEHHKHYLESAVELGCPVFVEKPLADDNEGLATLLGEAKAKKVAVCVGYQLRFHPGLRVVKKLLDADAIGTPLFAHAQFSQYLPNWHPEQNYKTSYTAKLGIILDASHEIDYLRWLLGEGSLVACTGGKRSDLEIEGEDMAAMLLQFKSGVSATVHVDMVQQDRYIRWCLITGTKGTLKWDYAQNKVFLNSIQRFDHRQVGKTFEPNDMYLDEMKHFLAVVEGKEKPLVSGEDGLKTLQVALAAKKMQSQVVSTARFL